MQMLLPSLAMQFRSFRRPSSWKWPFDIRIAACARAHLVAGVVGGSGAALHGEGALNHLSIPLPPHVRATPSDNAAGYGEGAFRIIQWLTITPQSDSATSVPTVEPYCSLYHRRFGLYRIN